MVVPPLTNGAREGSLQFNVVSLRANDDETPDAGEFRLEGAEG